MDPKVISDHLTKLLVHCEIRAAAFTTYTFDPEFFELEVIPLLLPGNPSFSTNKRVKQFQVREQLREASLDLEVFFDSQIFQKDGICSPSMEYRFHGIHQGNNAFHAKLALILVYDSEHNQPCLLVGAGSNNLTHAGWWENIECMHWEKVGTNDTHPEFLNQLIMDVGWLKEKRYLNVARGKSSALDKIEEYLSTCTGKHQSNATFYYGLNNPDRERRFPGFMRKHAREQWADTSWTLEIISPFFAENPKNREHEFFFDMGVREIHMFLPRNQEGDALCMDAYFDHINQLDRIQWACWSDETSKSLSPGQLFRRLHAKVYHFYNTNQSWIFVGSVNFTHKAMKDNVEAGFMVKLDRSGPLLKPIQQPESIRPIPPEDIPPGSVNEQANEEMPRIYLAYDWLEKRLTGVTEKDNKYTISIRPPEGDRVISEWPIFDAESDFVGDTQALEKLLRNGSLIKVTGYNTPTEKSFPDQTVMLMQTGWTHKPLNLPDLTPEEIVAIYAGMVPERREQLILTKLIKQLFLEGNAGDLIAQTDDFETEQFISEYAEIFHAFRQLKKRLSDAMVGNNLPQLNYYLTGTGPDSLPTLLELASRKESTVKPVSCYLLMLCTREIWEIYLKQESGGDITLNGHLQQLKKQILAFKSGDAIRLEENSPDRRKAFFKWFETQFFRAYRLRKVQE